MAYGRDDKPWWKKGAEFIGRRIIGGQGQGFGYQRGPDPTLGVVGPSAPMPGREPFATPEVPLYAQEAGLDTGAEEIGSRVWDWVKENPGAVLDAAGGLYGTYQEGRAQDRYADLRERSLDLEEREMERRAREREQERERRRQAYRNVLRSREEEG